MAKIDKKAKYDEFTTKDNKHCVGGYEIIKCWLGINGWKWYATTIETMKDKKPFIYYGYVEGDFSEWGTWYATDMESMGITEIPIKNLGNMAEFITA